jgi:hypothetical protein
MRPACRILLMAALLSVALVGCAGVAQPQWTANKPLQSRQQDVVECAALAAQAAQGAGSWSSDRAIRAGIFDNARDQYLLLCLQSRGWYQGLPPTTAAPRPPPPPRVTTVRAVRRCHQAALVKLNLWDGPAHGDDSPRWGEVWIGYVKRRLQPYESLTIEQRHAGIHAVIDQELAAIHAEPINWDACVGDSP